jgi:glutathione S-transferase
VDEEAEWTILYHGLVTFKGRVEFLRLMLEDSGAKYSNFAKDLYGPIGQFDAFRGSPEAVAAESSSSFPMFFPPAIWHRPALGGADGEEVKINQVAACMTYLGEKLGYAPQSAAERARADMITQNALDYISAGRLSFHPVKSTASYNDQKAEGDKASAEFAETRMKVFLHHFEKVVSKNKEPTGPVAGGAGTTYADFALFHVLWATDVQFNNEKYSFAWDNTKVPALKAFYAAFKTRANIAAYISSDRAPQFAGDSMM